MTDLETLLEGVAVRPSKSKESELSICCPFCPGGDNNFHLSVNIEKGVAYCFKCHWKSNGFLRTAKLLGTALGISINGTISRRARIHDMQRQKAAVEVTEQEENEGLPEEYEPLTQQSKKDVVGRRAWEYATGRGIRLMQMVNHKIGYAAFGKMAWRLLFPVMDERGRVRGCVGRALTGDQRPRYLNTVGTRYLWGVHQKGSIAVLAEGVMDAIRVELALMQKGYYVALARLGSEISPAQLTQLKQYDRVVVLPDWDVPGAVAAGKLAQNCAGAGIPVRVAVPEVMDGRDPGSMSDEEILTAVTDAKPWRRETGERLRLAAGRYADL